MSATGRKRTGGKRPIADIGAASPMARMTRAVHSWKQAGQAFVWRYPPHKKKCQGWHFTCDDAGCDSLVKLIEGIANRGERSRRSIALSPAASDVWSVPNFGEPLRESHRTMVLEYEPNFRDLLLTEHEGRLRLQVGEGRASALIDALKDLKTGGGDYALPSNDPDTPPIWIWWMLGSKR